jgi:ABC-type antimicrobial peptide transport system permease subunit
MRRTAEIGLRVAIGAQRRDVICLVLREGLVLVILGTALGVAAAVAATRLLRTFLYQVTSADITAYVIASSAIMTTAMIAIYLPARRAADVDPMIALRAE